MLASVSIDYYYAFQVLCNSRFRLLLLNHGMDCNDTLAQHGSKLGLINGVIIICQMFLINEFT